MNENSGGLDGGSGGGDPGEHPPHAAADTVILVVGCLRTKVLHLMLQVRALDSSYLGSI